MPRFRRARSPRPPQTWVMRGDRIRAAIARIRFAWPRWTAIAIVAVVLGAGFALGVIESNLRSTVANIALNVVATVVGAAALLFLFVVITQAHAFRRLIADQAATVKPLDRVTGKRPIQARAVVARLQDDRRAGSIFLDAPSADAGESFVADLKDALAVAGILALVIPPDLEDGNFRAAASREFERLARRAGVSDVSFERTLNWLASRRKVACVIEGMDTTAQIAGHEQTRSMVRRRADEMASSGYPFIAIVNPGSLPLNAPYDSVAITPVDYVDIALNPASSPAPNETTVRKAAMALQRGGLQASTIFSDSPQEGQLAAATAHLMEKGVVHFGCAQLAAALDRVDVSPFTEDETKVLRHLIARLLLSQSQVVDLFNLYNDTKNDDLFDVLLAIQRLEYRKILRRFEIDGKTMLGFIDPALGEAAIGWWLAGQREEYVLSVGRTDLCVAAEIYQRSVSGDADPTARWARAVQKLQCNPSALIFLNLAFSAVSADASAEVKLDSGWLARTWERSWPQCGLTPGDREELKAEGLRRRSTFVNQITSNAVQTFAPFLWSRVVGEEYGRNPHMLRRSICRVLGFNGDNSWNALKTEWRTLVRQQPLSDESLTSSGGRTNSLGSLCWILPSVVVTATEFTSDAGELLSELTRLASPDAHDSGGASPPHPSLEISLAEGCKDACFHCFTEGVEVSDRVLTPLHTLLSDGRSWASRLIALQGLFVACSLKPSLAEDILDNCRQRAGQAHEHALVKRYAQLLSDPLERLKADAHTQVTVSEYVWPDDIEALSEAGGELRDEAALILASFAMLLNFIGGREKRDTKAVDKVDGREARKRALTSDRLPPCLATPAGARVSVKTGCHCDLKVCGPDISHQDMETVRRPLSRAFAYRSLAATSSDDLSDTANADRAAKIHLRQLTA